MSIVFTPGGMLNVACDPSDLPETGDATSSISDAMVRCKNLRINQKGQAKTRDGSAIIGAATIGTPVWWIEEQRGTRYAFAAGAIYADEVSLASGLTQAQWAAIKYNAFNDTTENVFALNGTDRKRIENSSVKEWGIDAPTVAPTLSTGQGSGLTGEYNAKYTYVRKVDDIVVTESNPSPAGIVVPLVNASLAVSVTQPTDTQVTHIRLYRTLEDGGVYYYAGEIAIGGNYAYGYSHDWESSDGYIAGTAFLFTTNDATNSTDDTFSWEERFHDLATTITDPVYTQPFTSFDSTIADSGVGDEVATDHDRPPLGSYVAGPAFDGTCFIVKENLLYYCKPKQPEYWPALYYIEVSPPQVPGKLVVFHNGQPFYLTANEIYYIQGTGAGTFFPLPMKAKTGARNVRGAVSVAGKGIYHTGPDGLYLFSSGSDIKITEESLEPLFRGESVQDMPAVADMTSSWLQAFGNHLYFGYRSEGNTYPTNVLAMNLETSRVSYFEYAFEISATVDDETNHRLLTGGSDGYIRVIESTLYTDDAGTAIDWETQSKDFLLQTRKHFPRWNKYDVDASGADSCTGELILEGAVHASHTITGNRQTRRRLVEVGNGNRAAIRISGTGPVTIYAAESE